MLSQVGETIYGGGFMWILLQVFSQISVVGGAGGGVAYMAHIGGFVAGVALIFLFRGNQFPQGEVLRGG